MTDEARLRLEEGRRLLDAGDPDGATRILAELGGHPNGEIAGEAWLLIGTARYRADDEPGALAAWQQAADSGSANAWLGWRNIAEQHVRDGNLPEAITAYREADRRAPAQERGAIANRIAWLLKETGHDFAARRQFNRARGSYGTYGAYVTWGLIAINVAVYILDTVLGGFGRNGGPLTDAGILYGPLVAQGEWWRLITHAFLHAPIGSGFGILHILFNMYALFLFGPIMEELYGHLEYLVIYLLCALGGGVLTILAAPNVPVLGASGAIFGLFGLGFVVWRRHHLLVTRQARMILSQIGPLLVLNLVITFAVPGISWTGHVGGLVVGGLIGFFVPPSSAATVAEAWRSPDGTPMARSFPIAARIGIYLAVFAVLVVATGWYVNNAEVFLQ